MHNWRLLKHLVTWHNRNFLCAEWLMLYFRWLIVNGELPPITKFYNETGNVILIRKKITQRDKPFGDLVKSRDKCRLPMATELIRRYIFWKLVKQYTFWILQGNAIQPATLGKSVAPVLTATSKEFYWTIRKILQALTGLWGALPPRCLSTFEIIWA